MSECRQSILYLPKSPVQTASVLHRQPWYTTHEETILVNRLVRDDPSKTSADHRKAPTFRAVLSALTTYHLYPLYLIGFLALIPIFPVKNYLHLTLRRLGFSTFKANMLAIPAGLLQIPTVLCLAWSSSHFDERTWHCVFAISYTIPLLTALEVLPPSKPFYSHAASRSSIPAARPQTHPSSFSATSSDQHYTADENTWPRYILCTLLSGAPSPYPILLSWLSATSPSTHLRGTSVAVFTTLCLAGTVIASQIYQRSDEPDYYTGNKVLLAVAGSGVVALVCQRMWFRRVNGYRKRVWEAMSEEERDEYSREGERRRGSVVPILEPENGLEDSEGTGQERGQEQAQTSRRKEKRSSGLERLDFRFLT